ncbi:MAG: anion permease [Candidatus Dadabacteria bacterium]|nr:anion permease [Candidatus Dadabacteria bacterium]
MIIVAAIALSSFLAINIGGNNSAASMGPAYGAGARTKRESIALIAIFTLLGALIAGVPVITTMGNGIVPNGVMSSELGLVLIVLVIAAIFITWANLLTIPVATTHAIVCAIAGLGLYSNALNSSKFIEIVIWWLLTPIITFAISFLIGKFFYFKLLKFLTDKYSEAGIFRIFTVFLTISGAYVAFSAGSNNAANSIGPLVGMGLLNPSVGAVLAGVGMSIGAIFIGGRLIETVGKEIGEICIIRAVTVELIGGTLIFLASVKGIPVSLGEIITSGIIGFSCAIQGFSFTFKNRHVVRISLFWLVVPFAAIGLSYGMCVLYFEFGLRAVLGGGY